jgi:hypothetical protein
VGLDWFALDNLRFQQRDLAVRYDRSGGHYNKGPGLAVLVDGKVVASSKAMGKLVVSLQL